MIYRTQNKICYKVTHQVSNIVTNNFKSNIINMVGNYILEEVDIWYSALKSDFIPLNSINDNDLEVVWELI